MGKGEFATIPLLPQTPQSIISICNSYRPNFRPDVTDLDKQSAPSANVSICNSYQANRPVNVTDQDKPIPWNITSQSVTPADRNLFSKFSNFSSI